MPVALFDVHMSVYKSTSLVCKWVRISQQGVSLHPLLNVNGCCSDPQQTSDRNLRVMLIWIKKRFDSNNVFLSEIRTQLMEC